jgi:hypothetical protein
MVLQLMVGLIEQARGSLSAMLEVTRDPEQREIVTAALEAIPRANDPSRQDSANDERQ